MFEFNKCWVFTKGVFGLKYWDFIGFGFDDLDFKCWVFASSTQPTSLMVDGDNKQKYVYIFEFKVIDDTKTGKALAQIYDKEYAKKYQLDNHIIHKIGIEFHSQGHDVIFDMGEGFVIGRLG